MLHRIPASLWEGCKRATWTRSNQCYISTETGLISTMLCCTVCDGCMLCGVQSSSRQTNCRRATRARCTKDSLQRREGRMDRSECILTSNRLCSAKTYLKKWNISQEKLKPLHSCAGPVLRGCAVQGRELSLEFDDELLGDDTIMVTGHTTNVRNCLHVCCLLAICAVCRVCLVSFSSCPPVPLALGCHTISVCLEQLSF